MTAEYQFSAPFDSQLRAEWQAGYVDTDRSVGANNSGGVYLVYDWPFCSTRIIGSNTCGGAIRKVLPGSAVGRTIYEIWIRYFAAEQSAPCL